MEIRARYALMGLFTLAVIVAGFLFVYWLNSAGGLGARTSYRVRFDGPVAGLMKGTAVLFNGVRVGEVTALALGKDNPREVMATVAVSADTPVRADTKAGIEFQGLMGSPTVALVGGAGDAPKLAAADGRPPMLIADPDTGKNLTQQAREALRHIDSVVADNAEPFRKLVANLNTFSDALARNSGSVDTIVAGIERMTGGKAAKNPPKIYDIAAAKAFPGLKKVPQVAMSVPEPTALALFDTDRIIVRAGAADKAGIEGAQWPDNLGRVVQARLVQSFENAGVARVVGRPPEGMMPETQVLIDIRGFQIAAGTPLTAEVELAAKIIGGEGKIIDAKVFRASVPAASLEPAAASAALSDAFGKVAAEIVTWVSGAI